MFGVRVIKQGIVPCKLLGPAETTAKLTDLSDSGIVIDMCIVCRHVIILQYH